MCVLFETPSCLLLLVMPVDVLATRVRIQAPDEVFASCVEFAGLSLDLFVLRPCPATLTTPGN